MAGTCRVKMLAAVFAVGAGLMLAGAGKADEGITVQGSGTARAKPTQVEIECSLSGDAELASDATVKFRDAKKRALAAIEGMKNKDLSVSSDGVSINNALDQQALMMMRQGGMATPAKPHVQIMEKNHIVLANTDKLEPDVLLETVLKVLDVAKDAGFQVGTPPSNNYYEQQLTSMLGNAVVIFKVPDAAGMREQAYKAAFEDARAKAQKLAEMSGVKLGRVVSITEPTQGNKSEMSGLPSYMMAAMMGLEMKMSSMGGDEKGLISPTSGELVKQMKLTVQFEIAK